MAAAFRRSVRAPRRSSELLRQRPLCARGEVDAPSYVEGGRDLCWGFGWDLGRDGLG